MQRNSPSDIVLAHKTSHLFQQNNTIVRPFACCIRQVCVGGNVPLFEPKRRGRTQAVALNKVTDGEISCLTADSNKKEGSVSFCSRGRGGRGPWVTTAEFPGPETSQRDWHQLKREKRKRSSLGKIAERDPARSKRLRKPRYPTASGRGRPVKGFLGKRPLVYLRPRRRPSPSRSRRRTAAGHQAPRPWTCPGTRGSKGSARYQMTPPPSRVTRTL